MPVPFMTAQPSPADSVILNANKKSNTSWNGLPSTAMTSFPWIRECSLKGRGISWDFPIAGLAVTANGVIFVPMTDYPKFSETEFWPWNSWTNASTIWIPASVRSAAASCSIIHLHSMPTPKPSSLLKLRRSNGLPCLHWKPTGSPAMPCVWIGM